MFRAFHNSHVRRFGAALLAVGLVYGLLIGLPTYLKHNKKAPDADLIGLRLALQETKLILQGLELLSIENLDPATERAEMDVDRLKITSKAIEAYSSPNGLNVDDIASVKSIPANISSIVSDYESRNKSVNKLLMYEPALDLLDAEESERKLRASNTADALNGFISGLDEASVDFKRSLIQGEKCFRQLANGASIDVNQCIEDYSLIRKQAAVYAVAPFRGNQAQGVTGTIDTIVAKINYLTQN